MLNCQYCNKECKNNNSHRNHERMCKLNPTRKITPKNKEFYKTRKNSNQFLKARELGLPSPTVSDKTRKKLSDKSKSHWTDQKRKEWSDFMKIQSQKNLENHPESYSYKNFCGRSKKTLYNDEWMHSSWELEFAKWCDKNNIKWTKKVRYFEYCWKGSIKRYFPDFYLEQFDLYIEVKGYQTDRDVEKWKSVSNLVVVKDKDIKNIKEGRYNPGWVS